jgi:hypothetical protein
LVSSIQKYAVILFDNDEPDILDSKFDNEKLIQLIRKYELHITPDSIKKDFLETNHIELFELGIELIVPMQLQNKTRGIILRNRAGTGFQ